MAANRSGSDDATQKEWRANLRAFREHAGLTQEQAGELLGVRGHTVYRWEAGLRRIGMEEYSNALTAYGEETLRRKRDGVPRGTVREAPPEYGELEIDRLVREFDRDAMRMGAADAEADFARDVIEMAGGSRLFGDPGSPAEIVEVQSLLAALRSWLEGRIGRKSQGPDPIRPKDVPAEVEKRRAELATENPTRRTK